MTSSNSIGGPHTTKERFEKIQCLINTIRQIENEYNEHEYSDEFETLNQLMTHKLTNLRILADEAERCLTNLRYKDF